MIFKVEAVSATGCRCRYQVRGDIVLADKLAYHDNGCDSFGYKYGQMAGPIHFTLNPVAISYQKWKKFLEEEAATTHVKRLQQEIALSWWKSRNNWDISRILAVEMEGAAIAYHATGRPFMVIRAMGDTANPHVIFLLMNLS